MAHCVLEVADIFRTHGPDWRNTQRGHLNLGQLKVMSAIEQCRSAALGGHVLRCEGCGQDQIAYNCASSNISTTSNKTTGPSSASYGRCPASSLFTAREHSLPALRPCDDQEGAVVGPLQWPRLARSSEVLIIGFLNDTNGANLLGQTPLSRQTRPAS